MFIIRYGEGMIKAAIIKMKTDRHNRASLRGSSPYLLLGQVDGPGSTLGDGPLWGVRLCAGSEWIFVGLASYRAVGLIMLNRRVAE